MLTPLAKYALAVIFAIAPPGNKRLDVAKERDRLADVIAVTQAAAVEKNPHEIGWKGPAAQQLALVTMSATAWPESYFEEKTQDCRRKGDKGKSTTIYQLMRPWSLQRKVWKTRKTKWGSYKTWAWVNHHTQKELCESNELASEQFLHMWRVSEKTYPWATPHHLFQAYVSGKPRAWIRRVTRRCTRWAKIANKMGLRDLRTVKKTTKKHKKGDNVVKKIDCFKTPERVIETKDIDEIVKKQLKVYPKKKKAKKDE